MSRKITDLFGSMRMILPEYKDAILEHQFEHTLVAPPTIEQDELMEWSYLIQESMQDQKLLHIQYWHPIRKGLGEYRYTKGLVASIDRLNRKIKIVGQDGYEWIMLDRIVKMQTP